MVAGNLTYLGAQFLVFVALAQFVSPNQVGIFSWALAIAGPFFALADMRTQQVQLSTPRSAYPYRVFWIQRVFLLLTTTVLLGALGPLLTSDRSSLLILYGVIALKITEGLLNVPLGERLRDENMASVARFQLLRSVAYLVPFVAVLFATAEVYVALAASAAFQVIPVYLACRMYRGEGPLESKWRMILQMSKESFPLGVGFFIGSLSINAPRLILEAQHGPEQLASFAAVSYLIVVLNQVVDSVNRGVMPRMAGYWRASRVRDLSGLTLKVLLVIAVVGLGGSVGAYLFGDPMLGLIFGDFYGKSGTLLTFMLLASVVMYLAQALRNMLIAGGLRRGVVTISAANFAVSFIAALLLVPHFAGIGIALALIIGQSLSLTIYVVLSFRAIATLRARDD